MDVLKRIEILEKELAELKKQIGEETSWKIGRRFKPEEGMKYWYIDSQGTVVKTKFYANCPEFHRDRYAIGNCFRTREEAEFEVERLKVIAELNEFAEPEDVTWKDKNKHWYIDYNHDNSIVGVNSNSYLQCPDIYFDSYEAAEQCAKIVGEERIQKYYLRVKEE